MRIFNWFKKKKIDNYANDIASSVEKIDSENGLIYDEIVWNEGFRELIKIELEEGDYSSTLKWLIDKNFNVPASTCLKCSKTFVIKSFDLKWFNLNNGIYRSLELINCDCIIQNRDQKINDLLNGKAN